MKFSQLGQLALASAVSAALVLDITACGQSNTIDFVYVASANGTTGRIYAYKSDGQSGALSGVVGSPFPAGRNPVALVTSPGGTRLYALNHDDNSVIEYAADSGGKLTVVKTYRIPSGTNPNGMTMSPDGSTLYIVEAYGLAPNGTPYNATTPGIGALVQYPIQGTEGSGSNNGYGNLGTPVSYPTCNNPVAVAVLGSTKNPDPGSAVYVVNDPSGQLTTLIDTLAAQNRAATGNATVIYPAVGACNGGAGAQGQITSYVIRSNKALTPGAGSPFAAGVAPNAIVTDPSNRFVYVTDFGQNLMFGYGVQGSNGTIEPLVTPTTPTGQLPSALTIDPRGKFIYVTNYGDGNVSGYALNATNGIPSGLAGTSSNTQTDPGPAALVAEDSIGRYVYTANFIGNSVSSLYVDPNAGTTRPGQNSPFPGVAKATAVAAIKHGDHTIQVNPRY
ncbi:MAG TPA: beta-propeller fold lactonase family protein [Acidobacteriaceae bacterium]